jgi:prepilin-type N-terminal cleavage/methylation domain-containing protein
MLTLKHKKSGFTLIELLVVIMIIGILGGILLAAVFAVARTVEEGVTRNTLMMIRNGIVDYKSGTGQFPTSDQLQGTTDATRGVWLYNLQNEGPDQPYIKDVGDFITVDVDLEIGVVYDNWGNHINFRVVGGSSNTDGLGSMTIVELLKASNILGIFYVWSNGADNNDEFTDIFADSAHGPGWNIDMEDPTKWRTYKAIDDAYWEDYVDDAVVVSGSTDG